MVSRRTTIRIGDTLTAQNRDTPSPGLNAALPGAVAVRIRYAFTSGRVVKTSDHRVARVDRARTAVQAIQRRAHPACPGVDIARFHAGTDRTVIAVEVVLASAPTDVKDASQSDVAGIAAAGPVVIARQRGSDITAPFVEVTTFGAGADRKIAALDVAVALTAAGVVHAPQNGIA